MTVTNQHYSFLVGVRVAFIFMRVGVCLCAAETRRHPSVLPSSMCPVLRDAVVQIQGEDDSWTWKERQGGEAGVQTSSNGAYMHAKMHIITLKLV